MRLNFTANRFICGHTNRGIAPKTFSVNLQAENFQDASKFHGKPLRFWTHKSWNCARNFFCKSRRQRISKMRLNSTVNNFIFVRTTRENAPRPFLLRLKGENFLNASELRSKPLHFWTHKSRNCAQNFFCKTCRQRTSKMRLNFTANSFVFGRINRENAPRTFYIKHARRKRQKCV